MVTIYAELFEADGTFVGRFDFEQPYWETTSARDAIIELFAAGGYAEIITECLHCLPDREEPSHTIEDFSEQLLEAFDLAAFEHPQIED